MTTRNPMPATAAYPPKGCVPGRGRAADSAASAGTTGFLSLFLLLLAFFILLNSLAQFERSRTRAILGSLSATFNTDRPAGEGRELGSFIGLIAASDALERALDARLRTLLPLDRFDVVRTGSVMALEVDAAALFLDRSTPARGLADLATRVAAALAAAPEGYRFEIEVLARTGADFPGEAAPEAVGLAARRAGAVVRAFERAGIAAPTMLAGVGGGDPSRIAVEFRVLDARQADEGRRE